MGYYTRPGSLGHTIQCFEPDNSATELWLISGMYDIAEIIEEAKKHFGDDIKLNQLTISAHHIHTDCLYYDMYDSGDYTDYICIEYNPAG